MFQMLEFWILLYCLHSIAITTGARILGIFPMPGRSHFACNEAVMRSLYDAGHQITFVSPFSNDLSLKNYTVIDTKQDQLLYFGEMSLNDFKNADIFTVTHLSTKNEVEYCNNVLGTQEIQDLLNSEEKPFDVMFIEITMMTECFLPLAEKLNIPVIGVVTLRTWKLGDAAIGNLLSRAVIPDLMLSASDDMPFFERLQNLWYSLFFDFYYNYYMCSFMNEIYRKFYSPELINKKKVSVVFMNNHLSLSARAAVPNAIDIGGIHLKPVKPLPKDLQKFIDDAEHGVVVFSLGSIAKSNTMSTEIKAAFQEAFAEIPQRVIWKFDDTIENLSNNVLVMKWMPQRDILAHKNVKAFISHCGMSGTYEAMSEGVPMILTPLLADQYSNAAFLQKVGAGLPLDVYSATKKKVLQALNAVINDTRYRDSMKAVSKRFNDRPMSPQESVVYWTEHVIKHRGALHLRTAEADMPLYQYLLFDVVTASTVVVSVIFYIFIVVFRIMYGVCSPRVKDFTRTEMHKKIT